MSRLGKRLELARVERLVDRWSRLCQGQPLGPAAWAEPGLPLALILPIFLTLPFALTGPLRALLGWPLPWTLPLALLATAVALAPVWRVWQSQPRLHHPWVSYLVPSLLAFISIFVLYRREFAGLTNYVGADGGVHVFQRFWFADTDPHTYSGFVSMYALMYWIEQITGCTVYWSLCGAYYFGVALVAAIPCLVAWVVLARFSGVSFYAGALGCVVCALALAYFIVLPQQHYHQTDGFFPYLFALVPLLTVWLIDTATRARLWRWLGIGAAAGLYRYTYGLNLADLAIAIGLLFFIDSFGRDLPRVLRWSLRFLLLPLLALALVFLRQLEPLLASYGWIIQYNLRTVLTAQVFAVGGLALLGATAVWSADSVLGRAVRFPLLFAAVNGLLSYVGLELPAREPYYLLKYPIPAVVLLAGAFVVAAAFVSAWLVERAQHRRPLVALLVSAAVLAAGFQTVRLWRIGFAPFWPSFVERISGHPPFQLTHPLADLGAWRRISRTLERRHKKFGGYLTSYWPMFNFMNAGLGYYNRGRGFWDRGAPRFGPGYCVFWDRGKVDWWTQPEDLPAHLRGWVARLEEGQAECVGYRAAWNRSVERTLCYRCQ